MACVQRAITLKKKMNEGKREASKEAVRHVTSEGRGVGGALSNRRGGQRQECSSVIQPIFYIIHMPHEGILLSVRFCSYGIENQLSRTSLKPMKYKTALGKPTQCSFHPYSHSLTSIITIV